MQRARGHGVAGGTVAPAQAHAHHPARGGREPGGAAGAQAAEAAQPEPRCVRARAHASRLACMCALWVWEASGPTQPRACMAERLSCLHVCACLRHVCVCGWVVACRPGAGQPRRAARAVRARVPGGAGAQAVQRRGAPRGAGGWARAGLAGCMHACMPGSVHVCTCTPPEHACTGVNLQLVFVRGRYTTRVALTLRRVRPCCCSLRRLCARRCCTRSCRSACP